MSGRLLWPKTEAMGVYRLTIPGTVQDSLNPKARYGSSSFRKPRPREVVCRNNSTVSECDDGRNSSVFTAISTRSATISDCDESVLMDFASRASSIDDVLFSCAQVPKRHSTACCTDMAFRREQRRWNFEPPTSTGGSSSTSLAMTLSFRRELDLEDDRVDDHSLALWEETTPVEHVPRPVRNVHPAPHSWHAGDTAVSSGSSRNKKKLSKSFFNGLFSGLTSRRSRKSAS